MMRHSGLPLVLAAALVSAGASAAPAAPGPTPRPTPPHAKSHGHQIEGRIVSVTATRSLTLRTASGDSADLVLTKATHLQGGPLKPGDQVAVRYLARDGSKVATSIRVEESEAASPTAAVAGSR